MWKAKLKSMLVRLEQRASVFSFGLLSKAVPIGVKCRDGIEKFLHRLFRRRNFSGITTFLPILTWLPHYDWSHSFFGDLSGGLTMAVFSVPQGIALAGITGVPPVYGLYTAIFPSFLYIFFGTSKHNALGGFAVLSLMTHTAIEKVMMKTAISYNATSYVNHTMEELETAMDGLNGTNFLGNGSSLIEEITTEMWTDGVSPVKEIHVATTIIFFAGCIQVLMGVFRLQYLTTVFSEQVMSGFVVGGGVHVFFAQIGDVLGMKLPRRSGPGYLYYRICDLIENIGNIHYPTLAISLSSLTFLIFGKEFISPWLSTAFHFPIPFDLVLNMDSPTFVTLSSRFVPSMFPPPSLPRFDLIQYIGVNAVAIAMTAVAIHLTVAKIVEKRYKYKINHGQELYALGFVGVLSSFFPVFPVTSGFARSVVGAAVGSSTQTIWLMSMVLTVCFDMGEGLLLATGFAVLTTIIRMQRSIFTLRSTVLAKRSIADRHWADLLHPSFLIGALAPIWEYRDDARYPLLHGCVAMCKDFRAFKGGILRHNRSNELRQHRRHF
ncbi:inorganic anion transporter, SulP family [Teladorsagia circumcincta]|uniref:Inorganic anion transporter, SulP family n=1 Tax=Teladorsagia circumcincta TaxID=45464 RepID=A0A2G9URM3_TELCI|nr:inorganic anion transporter, SulP family [Teladorsagia circumcincta]